MVAEGAAEQVAGRRPASSGKPFRPIRGFSGGYGTKLTTNHPATEIAPGKFYPNVWPRNIMFSFLTWEIKATISSKLYLNCLIYKTGRYFHPRLLFHITTGPRAPCTQLIFLPFTIALFDLTALPIADRPHYGMTAFSPVELRQELPTITFVLV